MPIQAFIIRHDTEGIEFLETFLQSPNFSKATLEDICKDLGMSHNVNKPILIRYILHSASDNPKNAYGVIVRHIVAKKRGWMSVQRGKVENFPKCADPKELMHKIGESQWYGPVQNPRDENAKWYIRPEFISHWEMSTQKVSTPIKKFSGTAQEYSIRWLCYARMDSDGVSIHWDGFSHIDSADDVTKKGSQNHYWDHIPNLFQELGKLAQTKFTPPDLQNLILHKLWDSYRRNKKKYFWDDIKIRAEAGGVSLNARSTVAKENRTARKEIDIKGIKRLATTIERSIAYELREVHDYDLPDPEEFDEVILQTLIRDFGPLSYEFRLENISDMTELFRGHVFFGAKPEQPSRDSFPHIRVYITNHNDLEQLDFILKQLEVENENNSQSDQLSIF